MKKTFFFLTFLSLILGLLFMSCGSGKKLMVSEARVDKLQKDSANTHNKLNVCNAQVKNLNENNAFLQNENAMAQNDLKDLTAESKMTIAQQAKRLKNLRV